MARQDQFCFSLCVSFCSKERALIYSKYVPGLAPPTKYTSYLHKHPGIIVFILRLKLRLREVK